jgi:serine/threonine-protein kinase RsbW
MEKRILIIDDHDDLATSLDAEFSSRGFQVELAETRQKAVTLFAEHRFDVVITDLDGENLVASNNGSKPESSMSCLPDSLTEERSNVKAFKICLAKYNVDEFPDEDVEYVVREALNYKAKFIDRGPSMKDRHEKIDFEVPSILGLMGDILGYLMKRVEKLGVVKPEKSNLFVALDEAFVNAVKHGNKFDKSKMVRISVEISPEKAKFTIEDEGAGFDVKKIPDPTDPENLFKASGRGVMFIYNIMDEVSYNSRGNRLTMIKKNEGESE